MLLGLANWTWTKAMDEPLPPRPTLFFDLVLPSRSKYLFLNFWIADSHVATPLPVSFARQIGHTKKEKIRLDFAAETAKVAIRC